MAHRYPNGPISPMGVRNPGQSGTLGQSDGSFQMVSNNNGLGMSGTSSASSGRSFVVLNPTSPPVSTHRSPDSMSNNRSPDVNFVSSSVGVQQMSLTDVTLEQALDKVTDLQKENYDLREYLKENNEMMKKQYDTLAQWKDRVLENNEKSKQKFEESKQIIIKLRTEKEELERHVEQRTKSRSGTAENEVVQLQSENQQLKEENTAHKSKTQELKQKVAELSNLLSAKSSPVMAGDVSLMAMGETVFVERSVSDEEELNRLKQERDECLGKVSGLEDKVCQFKEHTDQLIYDCSELQKLKDQIQKENSALQDDNLKLSQQMQNVLMQSRKLGKGGTGSYSDDPAFESIARSGYSIVPMEMETQCAVAERVEHSVVGVQTQFNQEKGAAVTSSASVSDTSRGQHQEERMLIQTLKKQLTEKDKVVQKLESGLQQKQTMIEHYKAQQSMHLAQLTQEHHRKETELVQQLDAIQSELQQTKSEQSISYTSDIHSLRSQVLTLINEVHESQTKLNAASQAVDDRSNKISQLQQQSSDSQKEMLQQRSEADQLVQSLQMSVVAGQEALTAERGDHQATRKQAMELRTSFNQLVNDYKEMLDTFDEYKSQQSQQQLTPAPESKDNKKLVEEINRLTAHAIASEDGLLYRDEQINELRKEVARLKEETENIPVLKAQAEVWKADFDAERMARERQHAEKEKILEEMRNLQVQNQDLIDDLEGQSKQQMADMKRRHGTGASYQQVLHQQLHVGNPQQAGPRGYPPGMTPRPPDNPNAARGYPYPGPEEHGARGYPLVYPHPGQDENLRVGMHVENNQPLSGASQHDEGESQIYTCPKCELQCPDVDTLQIHVLECIDQPESTAGASRH